MNLRCNLVSNVGIGNWYISGVTDLPMDTEGYTRQRAFGTTPFRPLTLLFYHKLDL